MILYKKILNSNNKFIKKSIPHLLKIKKALNKKIIFFKKKYYTIEQKNTKKLIYKLGYKSKKLNLGCCYNKEKNWINVDIDTNVKPDIIDDVITLNKIPSDYINKIKSTHLLEHLLEEDGINALKNWFRVLKPGGQLSIECPNLNKCIKMIYSDSPEERRFGFIGIYGDPPQIKKSAFFHSHKYGWSTNSLMKKLKEIGFSDIKEVEVEEIYRCNNQKYKRDMRIIANKPKLPINYVNPR